VCDEMRADGGDAGAATAAGEAWLMTAPARERSGVGGTAPRRRGAGRRPRHQPACGGFGFRLLSFNCHRSRDTRARSASGQRGARPGPVVLATRPFWSWIGTGIKSVRHSAQIVRRIHSRAGAQMEVAGSVSCGCRDGYECRVNPRGPSHATALASWKLRTGGFEFRLVTTGRQNE